MSSPETLHVAAGGRSTRLRRTIDSLGFEPFYPKHLLPTGNPLGETILGRILRQALPSTDRQVVHAHSENLSTIRSHSDIPSQAEVVLAPPDNAFGPFIRPLIAHRGRILGASGDHYVDASPWLGLLDHHDSGPFPVTFAVARVQPVESGLVYEIEDNGRISDFYRDRRTHEQNPVNVGVYVFEDSEVVLNSLAKLGITEHTSLPLRPSPEEIARQLVNDGLVGAYELPPFTAFNVNDAETYATLLGHTATRIGQTAIGA